MKKVPEILQFSYAENFRDLGGYESADGRHVKYGLLYRSGVLYDVCAFEEDRKLLHSLGLKTVLDFRSEGEADELPDPPVPGAEYIRISAIRHPDGTEMDFSPRGIRKVQQTRAYWASVYGKDFDEKGMLNMYYRNMPFDNPAYREMFRVLLENEVPMVFHCTAGKDRTGVGAILILLALGVDEETAIEDYLVTNECRQNSINHVLDQYADMIRQDPKMKERILAAYGAPRYNAEDTLAAIHGKYDSLAEYFLQEFGLDEEKLNKLRDLYLE